MTKFSDEFIKQVKSYWEDNKGKFKHTEESGVHKKMNVDKKFGLHDLAEHFKITESQARRIIYVKKQ